MKKSKVLKVRIIVIILIILFDILVLPWILTFPKYIKEYGIGPAPDHWLKSFNVIGNIKALFTNTFLRKLWLWCQLLISIAILGVAWNTNTLLKKKNKIREGTGGPESGGNGQHGTARWQTEKETDNSSTVWYVNKKGELIDFKPIQNYQNKGVKNPVKRGGTILGCQKESKNKHKIWIDEEDKHTLDIGTTRSGKSRRLKNPTIWLLGQVGESMVINDSKGELYKRNKKYLEKQGYNVIKLDFRNPRMGNRWNPMEKIIEAYEKGNVPKASETAWDMATTIVNPNPNLNKEKTWDNGEIAVISALSMATVKEAERRDQKHLSSVYNFLVKYGETEKVQMGGSVVEVVPINQYMKNLPKGHPAKVAFGPASVAPGKMRTSFFSSALTDLMLFSDPDIAYMTSHSDHKLESIGTEKTAVFLVIPDEKKTRHVLASLYVDQAYQALVNVANEYGGRLPNRVNFILDEFGNMPRINNMDTKLTVAGGRGMKFHLTVQDLAQIEEKYGNKTAKTITGNCHNWLYLLTTDVNTAKTLEAKTGKYTVETQSFSSNVHKKSYTVGASQNITGRALLLHDEILRWPQDRSLVLRAREFPARLPLPDLSQWPIPEFEEVEIGEEKEQPYTETNIWLPDIYEKGTKKEAIEEIEELEKVNEKEETNEEIEEIKTTNVTEDDEETDLRDEKNIEDIEKLTKEEVAIEKEDNNEENEIDILDQL